MVTMVEQVLDMLASLLTFMQLNVEQSVLQLNG